MLGKLFLLFTVVPLIELYLLIEVGTRIGTEATIGIVLTTGLLGAVLAKSEGLRVLRNWQESIAKGQLPKEGVMSSVLVLVGGVLLVTPGVLTDLTGILLLVPPTRRAIASVLRKRLQARMQVQTFDMTMGPPTGRPPGPGAPGPGSVIDVDASERP